MLKKILLSAVLSFTALILSGADIFLAGDSTCANYDPKKTPCTGWGQLLQGYCKKGVKVNNLAIPGASTKTYIDRKSWDKLIAKVKKGDFVLIQFGHNDSHTNNKRQYTVPGQSYNDNLKKFIADVRAKGAAPVLVTSIARGTFNKKGVISLGSLAKYCNAAKDVAKETKVPVVDFNTETVKLFNKLGKAESHKLFMCSTGIEKSKKDVTHLNKKGAETLVKLFIKAVKAQKLPLAGCFK